MQCSIKTMSLEQLESLMSDFNQPRFRAKQLYEWIHIHKVTSYDRMTNVPLSLRNILSEQYPLVSSSIINRRISADGTRKYVVQFLDGECAEAVAIPAHENSPHESRLSICLSTQVGCPIGCSFCATGTQGFTRNLTADEIIDQLLLAQEDIQQRASSIVVMGQGEPFLNYDEVLKALRIFNAQSGMRIGARHITLSTCGILEGIDRLSNEPEQFTLAISLHSAMQETRDLLMPHVSHQPLMSLKSSLFNYIGKTNRRVSLEYLMIKNVNDSTDDLNALIDFCQGLLCHVNVLKLNPMGESIYQSSKIKTINTWVETLNQNHIEATIRQPRGSDIGGACGQLKNLLN